MTMKNPTPPTLAEMDMARANARAITEAQLAGSLIAWAVRGCPDLPADVLAVVTADDFFSQKPREIMQAIQRLVTCGASIDLVSVGKELASVKGITCRSADLAEIALKNTDLISTNSVLEAAHLVAAESRKDKAMAALGQAEECLHSFGGPMDSLQAALKGAQEVLDSEADTKSFDLNQHLVAYTAGLDAPERALKPVPTPWTNITRILRGGLVPGELVIVAARPSVGKSAFALNLAYSASCYGKGVVMFSLEMPVQQLLDRVVANVGGVELGQFRQGLNSEDRAKAHRATVQMRGKPFYIVDSTRVTVNEIRRRARIVKRQAGLSLVVIDYLQLLTPTDKGIPREQQVAQMSRELKCLAGELMVPVVLLAQLNRKVEENRRDPVLSDLRESGAIEQDADIVIFLHQARSVIGNPNEPVKVIVAKGRSSGVGSEYLEFNRKHQRLAETSEEAFRRVQEEEAKSYYGEEQELI